MHDLSAVLRSKWLERYLRGIGFPHPRWLIAGTEHREEQDGGARQPVDEHFHIVFRRRVNPVQILYDHDARPLPTAVERHLVQRFADLELDRRSTEQVCASGLWLHTQELEEGWRPGLRSHPYLLEPPMHLGDERCIGVILGDSTVTLEHIQHGEIGHGTTIGDTRPGEIGHPLWPETAAKLIQQPRFAHAGLANDTDHLP